MTDDAAPITQRGRAVLMQAVTLPLMYRTVLALIARRHRHGMAASPLRQQARTTLYPPPWRRRTRR
jgi:hypothetical protein